MKSFISPLCFALLSAFIFAGGMEAQSAKVTFSESETILKTKTGDLSGSLVVPRELKTFPIVLIIAGSGPTDRDCNSSLGIKTNAYKMLADSFAANGIATLRYDKRGIGKSSAAMTAEKDLRFENYVDDAGEWIMLLKKDKRVSAIYVLGHSEGSLIGMLAAAQYSVQGFISVAGMGKPADQLLRDQLRGKLPKDLFDESEKILDSLKAGKTVKETSPALYTIYRPSVQPYMISWFKYDPAAEIKKLQMPVLILQGTTDLQVATEEAETLAKAQPKAKLVKLDNMNHVLKEAEADPGKNMATYYAADLPLKQGLMVELIKFVKQVK